MSNCSNCCSTVEIKTVGFDLDHTLVRYHLPAFRLLLHNVVTEMLLDKHLSHLSPESQEEFFLMPYDTTFGSCKGLVYDQEKGHILKINNHLHIVSLVHGNESLPWTREQIYQVYPDGMVSCLSDPIFLHFQTEYDTALLCLVRNWVTWIDKRQVSTQDEHYQYKNLFDLLYPLMDTVYLNWNDSLFYQEIRSNPDLYLVPRPRLKKWLFEPLRTTKTFILTNSIQEYVSFACNHLFGPDWQKCFDFVICDAKKPQFFEESEHPLLQEGNNVLYFEDSFKSGVVPAVAHTSWNCACVVEEILDTENNKCCVFGSPLENNHWLGSVNATSCMIVGCLEQDFESWMHKVYWGFF